jgi:DNA-binding transcriptional LysR family regulator
MTIGNITQVRLQDLQVFQSILENQSITAAADVLGLTQSAVSKRLKLLREHFGDELFVRTAGGMVATSKALFLAPRITSLITDFEALSEEGTFNPRQIERNFVISTTDEIQYFLLPNLIKRIELESPRSRLIFRNLDRTYAAKQLESGTVDLVVTMNWHIPEHLKQKRLFTDNFVCLHRKGHPLTVPVLTLENYLSARHMMVSPVGTAAGPVDEVLDSFGHTRFVSLSCPYFMQVEDALKTSDLLLTLQRRACEVLTKSDTLAISELPIQMNPVHYNMFWHKRYDRDSTNRWLREQVVETIYR